MTAFVADRSPHGLVVVRGNGATSFLQSLVSQDLDPMTDGESRSSLLLSPQGKLDVLFRITKAGDEWWLDTEADFGSRLAESLTRYRIRVKAEIEDRTSSSGLVSTTADVPTRDGALRIATKWGDVSGIDVIGPIETVRTIDPDGVERWTADQFEAFRIEQGVPRLGIDIDDKTIPQEAFLDRDAVSFTKGCYLGQELVARIDSRGHVNRHVRRLRIDGDAVPPRGASVFVDDKDVGTITSAVEVPGEHRTVALGMLRREVEPPTEVTIRWDTGEAKAQVSVVPPG